jgi:hypothetical protein
MKIKKFNLKINKSHSITSNDIILNFEKDHTVDINKLNAIRSIYKKETIESLATYYEKILYHLNLDDPDWDSFLSKRQKEQYMSYIKNKIDDTLKITTDYFFNAFIERLEFFRLLKPVFYNENLIKVPKYKHDSLTGRVSITNGHNFLTMKKEDRNNLISPYEDHCLLEIDFSSCEPYFYLSYLNKINSGEDVYNMIRNNLNIKKEVERSKLKRAIISILYEASNGTVKKLSGLSANKIKEIREYLETKKFKASLRKEFDENEFIINFYGRPVLSDANLINYWIQSSAVDFCCLSFYKFLCDYDYVKLHAMIHDAIIVSCPNDKIDIIRNIKALSENVSKFNIPIKINVLSSNN